jgi:hypothetical protein
LERQSDSPLHLSRSLPSSKLSLPLCRLVSLDVPLLAVRDERQPTSFTRTLAPGRGMPPEEIAEGRDNRRDFIGGLEQREHGCLLAAGRLR